MDQNERDPEQRFIKLIDESSPIDSYLTIRFREDAVFRRRAALMIDALEGFYRHISRNALQNFKGRLNRWIKHPPTSYTGFFGELCVADQLRKWGILHQFMREEQGISGPDLELTVREKKVFLEVKTLQENLQTQFFKQVRNEVVKLNLDISYISIRKIEITIERFDALVAVAVRLIQEATHNNRNSSIKYKGEEGEFYIHIEYTTAGQTATGWISSWPGSRLRADNTPWAQSVLEETLRDNIDQFRSNRPTFLAWVSLDVLLPDLETHAAQVLERFGQTEFVDVAGIMIFDSYRGYALIENRCGEYSTLEYLNLFTAIRSLSIGKTLEGGQKATPIK